jgi:aspartyl-tRNA(Asn)/glutamyl-tRNA(Gln) amidotransferase subunit A
LKKYTSLSEIQALIDQKELVLPDLLAYYFTQIETHKNLNAFNEVFFDSAQKQAVIIQEKINNGTAGKLAGMVIGIKDNILYKDHATSASSKMLEGFISPYSSTVAERLIAEDAVIIGRLNCDEFAMGGSNETSYVMPRILKGYQVVHRAVLRSRYRQTFVYLPLVLIPADRSGSQLLFADVSD